MSRHAVRHHDVESRKWDLRRNKPLRKLGAETALIMHHRDLVSAIMYAYRKTGWWGKDMAEFIVAIERWMDTDECRTALQALDERDGYIADE